MNANQIREMKAKIREMQAEVDYISNEAAGNMLAIMKDTGKAYTGAELSLLTENILTPSQAASAVRAVIALNPDNDFRCDRHGRSRRPTTKYRVAGDYTNMDVKLDKATRKTFSIACDENGYPLANAVPKSREHEVTTYQFENNRG